MVTLSDRQTQILKAIIEEYMETAEPVGSEIIDKKYNLGVSPATIRNEMAFLVKEGFLKQPHTSAGRLPTPMAIRFYIQQLMQEKDLSVADEAVVKNRIWDFRDNFDRLLKEATRFLSEKTKNLAILVTEEGDVYHYGSFHILEDPEFFDIDLTKAILSIVDDFERMNKFFSKAAGDQPVHVLLGDEFDSQFLEPCGMVFSRFETRKTKGNLGVVGSCRLNYTTIIPVLRYLNSLIEEIGRE
jgi:heat-inducible transcriptional repressor